MREFGEIDAAYGSVESAAVSGWQVTEVAWAEFDVFHRALKNLEQCLQDHDLVEEWGAFVAYYKRYRFFISTTPFPAKELTKQMSAWKTAKSPVLGLLLGHAPEPLQFASRLLIGSFDRLQQEEENPLWRVAIADIRQRRQDDIWIGVVCTETRLKEPLQKFLNTQACGEATIWAVRPVELKTPELYEQLVVLGPTRRYVSDGTDYVFKCPRAEVLTLFTPEVFRATVPRPYDLLGSPHEPGGPSGCEFSEFAMPQVKRAGGPAPDGEALDSSEDEQEQEWIAALPKLDVVYRPRNDGEWDGHNIVEAVHAKQVLLTADHVVYLAEGGSVSRLVVDTVESTCVDVEHVEIAEVGAEDALLFSSEGGGDMIAEVADRIMDDNAVRYRRLQREWKSALGSRVAKANLSEVACHLREKGSKIASTATVRNWCSMWNIGPGTWRSFEAVLGYCELEARKDEFFEATELIRAAHRRAGFELSKRLRERMIGLSLEELYSAGKQEFGGTEALPNRKVAFLVTGITTRTMEVSPYDILHPFEIEDKSWR
jgi:hypothetical protein